MDNTPIQTVEELEARIGAVSPALELKVIDHLDDGALRWIAACSLLFLGHSTEHGIHATTSGGVPGYLTADKHSLRIPVDSLDHSAPLAEGDGIGTLLILPRIGEMLRINGRVLAHDSGVIHIGVDQCFVHCAKALIRSAFWEPKALRRSSENKEDGAACIEASRFMVIATADSEHNTDVSPKGDPAGLLASANEESILFADRPGNRRADSFKNILSQPRVAGVFLEPGSDSACRFEGRAVPGCGPSCDRFAVNGRVPKLATQIATEFQVPYTSQALRRSQIWSRSKPDLDSAKILATHMRLNKNKGLAARVASSLTSVPGVMRKGLDKDYKDNLY